MRGARAARALGHVTRNVEALLGRFVDVSWAYRFGPPAQDLVAVSLERDTDGGEPELISQSFRFPAGRPPGARTAEELGLQGSVVRVPGAGPALRVASTRFVYGVRVGVPGHVAADDAFSIEPGHERLIGLSPVAAGDGGRRGGRGGGYRGWRGAGGGGRRGGCGAGRRGGGGA